MDNPYPKEKLAARIMEIAYPEADAEIRDNLAFLVSTRRKTIDDALAYLAEEVKPVAAPVKTTTPTTTTTAAAIDMRKKQVTTGAPSTLPRQQERVRAGSASNATQAVSGTLPNLILPTLRKPVAGAAAASARTSVSPASNKATTTSNTTSPGLIDGIILMSEGLSDFPATPESTDSIDSCGARKKRQQEAAMLFHGDAVVPMPLVSPVPPLPRPSDVNGGGGGSQSTSTAISSSARSTSRERPKVMTAAKTKEKVRGKGGSSSGSERTQKVKIPTPPGGPVIELKGYQYGDNTENFMEDIIGDGGQVIVFMSSMTGDRFERSHMRALKTLLLIKRIPHHTVDVADNAHLQQILMAVHRKATKTAKQTNAPLPALCVDDKYIGDLEKVQQLEDAGELITTLMSAGYRPPNDPCKTISPPAKDHTRAATNTMTTSTPPHPIAIDSPHSPTQFIRARS